MASKKKEDKAKVAARVQESRRAAGQKTKGAQK